MNINQMRCINAIVKSNFNLSMAAIALHATQPGVSAQIKQLENELGIFIFQRKGKRILGLTPAGKEVHRLGDEILKKISNIRLVGEEFNNEKRGVFTIATTHTQARYALPSVIAAFAKRYPEVQLRIRQGNPKQISEMVLHGEADIVIATEAIPNYDNLAMLPVYRWNRCVVARPEHPILQASHLHIKDIAEFPLLTYDFAFTGRSIMNRAFEQAGLIPNVVLTAIDSDVIKHYVELGLGIGIIANLAFDVDKDTGLKTINASHLFEYSVTSIGLLKNSFLRSFMYDFIEMFAPHLNRERVSLALQGGIHHPETINIEELPLR